MAVAHQLGTGGEVASHARLHTVKHVPQIRSPPEIAATECRPCIHHGQLLAFKRRNSAGGAAVPGGWMLQSSYPAPTGTPRLDSGLRARHRSEPPGDCGN